MHWFGKGFSAQNLHRKSHLLGLSRWTYYLVILCITDPLPARSTSLDDHARVDGVMLAALCDQLATRAFIALDVETTLVDRNL